MKLENQVCSLEQAIKLFELGVSLSSQFAWCWNGAKTTKDGRKDFFLNLDGFKHEWAEAYPAFTVAELGVMLPRNYASFDCGYDLWRIANTFNYANGSNKDVIGEYYIGQSKTYTNIHKETEAQVRAALLIHLIESSSSILTAESINSRMNAIS